MDRSTPSGGPRPGAPAVVLTCRNGERFLGRQWASLRDQSTPPGLVVVVDDGSDDGSLDLLRGYRQDSPFPVTIVVTERRPEDKASRIAAAVARGLAECRAYDVVAFCDQDDVWHPRHLELLTRALELNPQCSYAFSNAGLIDEQGNHLPGSLFSRYHVSRRFNELPVLDQFRHVLRKPRVTGMTMMIRAALIPVLEVAPPGLLHDRWTSLVGPWLGGGVAVRRQLADYRRHPGQAVGAPDRHLGHKAMRALRRLPTIDVEMREVEALRWAMREHVLSSAPGFERALDRHERMLSRRARVLAPLRHV